MPNCFLLGFFFNFKTIFDLRNKSNLLEQTYQPRKHILHGVNESRYCSINVHKHLYFVNNFITLVCVLCHQLSFSDADLKTNCQALVQAANSHRITSKGKWMPIFGSVPVPGVSLFIHLLTHSLSHSFTHSLTYSFIYYKKLFCNLRPVQKYRNGWYESSRKNDILSVPFLSDRMAVPFWNGSEKFDSVPVFLSFVARFKRSELLWVLTPWCFYGPARVQYSGLIYNACLRTQLLSDPFLIDVCLFERSYFSGPVPAFVRYVLFNLTCKRAFKVHVSLEKDILDLRVLLFCACLTSRSLTR